MTFWLQINPYVTEAIVGDEPFVFQEPNECFEFVRNLLLPDPIKLVMFHFLSSWSAFIDEIIGVSGGKYAIMGKAPYNLIFYAVREGWVIVMDSIDDMFMEWNG